MLTPQFGFYKRAFVFILALLKHLRSMAQKPIIMGLIKQIKQLHNQGVAIKEIVRRTKVSRNSVRKYLHLANTESLAAEDIREVNDEGDDEQQRFDLLLTFIKNNHGELRRTGVTRGVLWKEYLGLHPGGYSYSQFCHHLSVWLKQKDVAMHLEYTPADLMMVDFAGKKLSYVDMLTGEVIKCEVFIAILTLQWPYILLCRGFSKHFKLYRMHQ